MAKSDISRDRTSISEQSWGTVSGCGPLHWNRSMIDDFVPTGDLPDHAPATGDIGTVGEVT